MDFAGNVSLTSYVFVWLCNASKQKEEEPASVLCAQDGGVFVACSYNSCHRWQLVIWKILNCLAIEPILKQELIPTGFLEVVILCCEIRMD